MSKILYRKSIEEKDWISCKEKLPLNGQKVICLYEDDAHFAKFRNVKIIDEKIYWTFDLISDLNEKINEISTDDIQYWTPIP